MDQGRDEVRHTVFMLAIAAFLGGAALRLCDGLLPRLASDFHVTAGTAGLVVVVFSIGYAAMQLVFGPLGDRFGKGAVISLAVAGCACFSLFAALAQEFHAVVISRAAWGMAAAGIIPLAMAWIGDVVSLEERQATLGKLLMGTLSGMMFGQAAGGLFADSAIGWRGAFALMSVGYMAIGCVLAIHVRATPRTLLPPSSAMSLRGQWMAVLRSRWALCVFAAAFAEGVFLLGPMAYLPAILKQGIGVSTSTVSALLGLYAAGGFIYASNAKRLVARFGQKRMAAIGGVLMGASYLIMFLDATVWTVGPLALMLGLGAYLFHGTLQTHATQLAETARGMAVSLFAFSLFLGQGVGSSCFGWAFDSAGAAMVLLPAAMALPAVGLLFAVASRNVHGTA